MTKSREDHDSSNADRDLQQAVKDLQDLLKRSGNKPDPICPAALRSRYLDPLEWDQSMDSTKFQQKTSSAGQATGFSGSPLKFDAGSDGSSGSIPGGGGGGRGIGCGIAAVLLGIGLVIWLIVKVIRWLL